MSELVPEMVERVARAISGAPFPSPASYRKARAAIEAMREPRNEMLAAGEDALATARPGCWDQLEDIWQAMISGALSSPAPTEES